MPDASVTAIDAKFIWVYRDYTMMKEFKKEWTTPEVAEKLNVSVSTLKAWEQEFGVRVPRGSRNRRRYFEEYLMLFIEIKRLREAKSDSRIIRKKIGPTVKAIEVKFQDLLVELPAEQPESCSSGEILVLLQEKDRTIQELYQKIEMLQHTKEDISKENARFKDVTTLVQTQLAFLSELTSPTMDRALGFSLSSALQQMRTMLKLKPANP